MEDTHMTELMDATTIKAFVDSGRRVFTGNTNYEVIKDSLGRYLIKSHFNGYICGLTYTDGRTLNSYGPFFIEEN